MAYLDQNMFVIFLFISNHLDLIAALLRVLLSVRPTCTEGYELSIY